MDFKEGLLNLYSRCIYYAYKDQLFNTSILLLDHFLSILTVLSIFPLHKDISDLSLLYLINPKSQLDFLNKFTNPILINIMNYDYKQTPFAVYTNIFIFLIFLIEVIVIISVVLMFLKGFRYQKKEYFVINSLKKISIMCLNLFLSLLCIYIYLVFFNQLLTLINISHLPQELQTFTMVLCYFTILSLIIYTALGVFYFYFVNSPFPIFNFPVNNFNNNDYLLDFILKFFLALNSTFQSYHSVLIFEFPIVLILLFYLVFLFVKINHHYMNIYSFINIFYLVSVSEIILVSWVNTMLFKKVSFIIFILEFLILILINSIIYLSIKEKFVNPQISGKKIFHVIYKLVIQMHYNEKETRAVCVKLFQKHKFLCQLKDCIICKLDITLESDFYRIFYSILYKDNGVSIKKSQINKIYLKLILTFKMDQEKIHRICIFIQKVLKRSDIRTSLHISFFFNYIKNLNEKENFSNQIMLNYYQIHQMNKTLIEGLISFIKGILASKLSIDEIMIKTKLIGSLSEKIQKLNDFNELNKKIFTIEVEMAVNFLVFKFVFNRELKYFNIYNIFDNIDLKQELINNFNNNSSLVIRFDSKLNIWKIRSVSNRVVNYLKFQNELLIDKNFDFLFPLFLFPEGIINDYFSKFKEDNVSLKSFLLDKDNSLIIVNLILKFIPSPDRENLIYVEIDFDTYKSKNTSCLLILNNRCKIMLMSPEFSEKTFILPNLLNKVRKLYFKDIFGFNLNMKSSEKQIFKLNLAEVANNIHHIQSNTDIEVIYESKNKIYLYLMEKIPNILGIAELKVQIKESFRNNKYFSVKLKFSTKNMNKNYAIRRRPIKSSLFEKIINFNVPQESLLSSSLKSSNLTDIGTKYNKILMNIPEYCATEKSINGSILDNIVKIICYLNLIFLLIAVVFICIIHTKLQSLTVFFEITTNFQKLDSSIYNLLINVDELLILNNTNTSSNFNSFIAQFQQDIKTDLREYIVNEMPIKLNNIILQTNIINTLLTHTFNSSIIDNYINFEVKYYNLFPDGDLYLNKMKFLYALNYFNNELIILTGTKNRYFNISLLNINKVNDSKMHLSEIIYSHETLSILTVIINFFPLFSKNFEVIYNKLIYLLSEKLDDFELILYYFLSTLFLGNIVSIVFTIIAFLMYSKRMNSALNFIFSLEKTHYYHLLKKFELINEVLTFKSCPSSNFIEIQKVEENYLNSIYHNSEKKVANNKKNDFSSRKNNYESIEIEKSAFVNNKISIINKDYYYLNHDKMYFFTNKKNITIKSYVLVLFYLIFIVGIILIKSYLMTNIYLIIQFKSNFYKVEKNYIFTILSVHYLLLFNSTNFFEGDFGNNGIDDTPFQKYSQNIYESLYQLKQVESNRIFQDFYRTESLFKGENICPQLFSNNDSVSDFYNNQADLIKDLMFICNKTTEIDSDLLTILTYLVRESRKVVDNFSTSSKDKDIIISLFNSSPDISKMNIIVIFFLRRYFDFFFNVLDNTFNTEISSFFINHILLFLAIILYDCVSLIFIKLFILDKIVESIHHTKNLMGIIKH